MPLFLIALLRSARRDAVKARAVLVFAALLEACSEPRLSPLASDATVLAFGDSLTFGTGAAPAQAYPAVLAAMTSMTVINAGIPGEVTAEGRARLPAVLREHGPDLVILVHGGNDILRNHAAEETRANLRAMARLCRDFGAEVVMLGVPGRNLTLSAPGYYSEIAEAMDVPIDTSTLPGLMRDRSVKSDAVHLNGEGYRLMAIGVETLLRGEGALP